MSEQSMRALREHANPIRLAGAEVRAAVTVGTMTIAEALDDPRAGVLTITRLLCAQHYFGALKAGQILGPLSISANRRVRDLTDRQKYLIVHALMR